jgi:hypothetical protein
MRRLLIYLFSLPNVNRMRNAYRIVFGLCERKRPLGTDVDWKIILKCILE